MPDGKYQTVTFIVPPTDQRTNDVIQAGYEHIPVKRQFFAASFAKLNRSERSASIWCEDDENIVIRIPLPLYERVASIFGDRFLNVVSRSLIQP